MLMAAFVIAGLASPMSAKSPPAQDFRIVVPALGKANTIDQEAQRHVFEFYLGFYR